MKKTNKKGFTIVELVIVIAVIAILAAVLIPTFAGVVKNAQKNADIAAAKNAYTELMVLTEADLSKLSNTTYTATSTTTNDAKLGTDVAKIIVEVGVTSVQYTAAANSNPATLAVVCKNGHTVTYSFASTGTTVETTPAD